MNAGSETGNFPRLISHSSRSVTYSNKEQGAHEGEREEGEGREGTTDIPARTQVGPQGTSGNAAAAAAVITRKREGGRGRDRFTSGFLGRPLPPSLPPCAPRPPLSSLVPHSTKCGYEAKIRLRTIQWNLKIISHKRNKKVSSVLEGTLRREGEWSRGRPPSPDPLCIVRAGQAPLS